MSELDEARRREIARIRAEYARRARELPAERYSPQNPGHRYLAASQDRAMTAALVRARLLPLGDRRLLEIGCGSGRWLRFLVALGADPRNVRGIDLDPARLTVAGGSGAPVVAADAAQLPFADAGFDLVLQSTVLSSILDPVVRSAVAAEMLRVLAPGGAVFWYDLRIGNPRNPQVRGIGRRRLRSLFPACTVDVRRTTLAPPLARLLAPRLPRLAALLDKALVFASHDLAVIRRRCDDRAR